MSLRLPGASGAPLSFSWNGRRLQALAGDSVAQALLANGIRGLAWTRKAHRPAAQTESFLRNAATWPVALTL